MSLKELLSAIAANRYVVRPLALPVEPHMLSARKRVERTLSESYAIPPGIDLKVIHKRLADAISSGRWDTITMRDWRYACHCLVMGDRPLINEASFLEIYLQKLTEMSSKSALLALIRFYLYNFNLQNSGIRKIALFLAVQATKRNWVWRERHNEVSIFNPALAPDLLSKKAQEAVDTPVSYLERMGFEGSLASARLAGYAFLKALEGLQLHLGEGPSIEAIQKITSWGITREREFRYGAIPRARGRLAEALLLPWQNREPTPEVREYIERFLLEHYRDIRVDSSRWNDVSEGAKQIILRWLTKASLEQFLQVVDLTASSADARRMWPARRKFWYAFYNRGYMQEAWVVFGRDGANRARGLGNSNEGEILAFGRTTGSGFQANHAVLLMRIGDIIVADWSHMGKCHIWLGNNPKAPKLYGIQYNRSELTNSSDFEQVHIGRWQDIVYRFLNRHVRAPLSGPEYFELMRNYPRR